MKKPAYIESNRALLFVTEGSVFILLAVFVLLFLYCLFFRVTYPFELEWLEGELLGHGLRFLCGAPVYGPPQTDFIPQVYPPLYFLFMTPLLKLFSVHFWIPRVISLISLLGILSLLFFIPVKEGGNKRAGALSAGLFIALYEVNGTWYDIGRNDMLFYFLIISGCFSLAYAGNKTGGALCSAVFFLLGFYTKQSAPMFIGCASLYLFMQHKKRGIIFFASLVSVILIILLAVNSETDGWYLIYTFINPLRHTAKRPHFLSEIRQDLFHELPIFFVMLGAVCLKRLFSFNRERPFTIWEYTLIPAALCYIIPRPLAGSERNELIPLTLWGCMLLGIFVSRISRPENRGEKQSSVLAVYALILFQLLLLLYNPAKLIPATGSREKGAEFIAMVKNIPGEVYIPYHSVYGIMAGKKMLFNGGAFWGYEMTSKEKYRPLDLIDKIEKKYFSAIILDGTGYYVLLKQRWPLDNSPRLFFLGDELSQAIGKNYEEAETLAYSSIDQFRPVTGYLTRPERVLRPRVNK